MFNNQTLFANKLQKQDNQNQVNEGRDSQTPAEVEVNEAVIPTVSSVITTSTDTEAPMVDPIPTISVPENDKYHWLEKVVNTMLVYDLSPKEVRKAYYERARAKVRKVAPKWRGPEGQLWSGRGRKPVWFREALESGQDMDQYLI